MRSERAILDDVFTSCVCCSISSDKARTFSSQIQRCFESVRLKIFVQFFENHSRLASNNRTDFVETLNFIHISKIEENLIEDGNTSANESSISTLRNNSKSPLIAIAEYLRNLICIFGTKQQLGIAFVELPKAQIMRSDNGRVSNNILMREDRFEVLNIPLFKKTEVLSLQVVLPVPIDNTFALQ